MHAGRSAVFGRVIDALRDVPGALECRVFGSWASGTADEHSDLDLHLLVQDIRAAGESVIGLVDARVPLDLAWPIRSQPRPAWKLLPSAGSVAHRIDVGLVTSGDTEESAPAAGLWKQTAAPPGPHAVEATHVLQPAPGSDANRILGEMIGATRYVKARLRGDEAMCASKAAGLARALKRAGETPSVAGFGCARERDEFVVGGVERLATYAVASTTGSASPVPPALARRLTEYVMTVLARAV